MQAFRRPTKENEANTEYIVLAVNAHEDLMEELRQSTITLRALTAVFPDEGIIAAIKKQIGGHGGGRIQRFLFSQLIVKVRHESTVLRTRMKKTLLLQF